MKIAAITHCTSGEGKYLLEWAAWLSLIGVSTVFVFEHNNDPDPEFVQAKAVLERIGLGEFGPAVETKRTKNIQMDGMLAAAEICVSRGIDWLVSIDLDEFPVITRHENLAAFLAGIPVGVDQIIVNWRMYGSSGEKSFDPSRTHFEKFTHCAVVDFHVHRLGKAIVRPAKVQTFNLHVHDVEGVTLDGSLRRMLPASHPHGTKQPEYLIGWLCHFAVRSRGEFEEKVRRGYPDEWHGKFPGEPYWRNRDRNEVRGADLGALSELIHERLALWISGGDETAPANTAIEGGRIPVVGANVLPSPPPFIPLWRAKAILELDGKLAMIEQIINGLPDGDPSTVIIRNAWYGNADLEWNGISVKAIAQMANLSQAEVADLFIRAGNIVV